MTTIKKTIYEILSKRFDTTNLENVYRSLKYTVTPLNYEKAVNPTITKDIVKNYNKNRHSGAHSFICKAPFNSLNFDSYGIATVCCFNRTLQIGNIQESTLNEIWNGKNINDLRAAIKNYDFSKGCIACEKQLLKNDFQHFGGRNSDITGIHEDYPTHLSFELTNICNLECVMCSGRFSNLIRKKRDNLPALKMAYNDNFIEQLKPFLEHAEFVDFFGGEPTMTKMNYEIWEYLTAKNLGCMIQVTTNATEIPERFIPIINNNNMSIIVSLDAYEKEVYERIRINATYETTFKNIDYYHSLFKSGKINMQLSICPMTINWQQMPKLVRYANKLGVRICFNQVTDPKKLSILYLTELEILHIVKELKQENFPENGIAYGYNLKMYSSLITRLEGWAKEAADRSVFIKSQLLLEYDDIKRNTIHLFLSSRTDGKEKMTEYLNQMFVEIESKYNENRHLIAAINFYECQGHESLNFEYHNKEQGHYAIQLHIKNISEIIPQIQIQIKS